MIDLGFVRPGSTVRIPFGSFAAATGAPSAVTNYADADIQVYKDGGTTQRASAAGMTATTTFDTLTGINLITIDLANNTTAGFWAAGSEYFVVISDITVDAQTLRFPIGRFRIGLPGAMFSTTIATLSTQTSFTLTVGPAENSALLGCVVYIHDVASAVQCGFGVISAYTGATKTVTLTAETTFTAAATDNISILAPVNASYWNALTTVALPLTPTVAGRTLDVSTGGEAGIDMANVGSPTATVGLTNTTIATSQVVASVSGAVGSVTGAVGSVTGAVGSVTGSVGSVTGLTASNLDTTISSRMPTTHIAATAGKVDGVALVDTTTTNTDMRGTDSAATAAELAKVPKSDGTTSWNATALAAINAEADTALTDYDPPTKAELDSGLAGLNDPTAAAIADAVWDETLTGANHNDASSAGRRLRTLQDFGVYDFASVWVDEVAGTSTGTTSFEDATVTNRANDFDNAQTVADAVGINSIQISNGNSVTLTAALEGYNLYGNGSALALGGQNLGGTIIREFAQITGTGTTTANPIFFDTNLIGAVTLPPCIIQQCGIGLASGTFTVGSAGNFVFVDCYSRVAGSSAPVVDLGAIGATTMEFRRWSGGLTLNNVATGDVVSVDCVSGGTVTVNGTGGSVSIRGMVMVVDGSGGAVTITQTQALNTSSIADQVWDEALAGHAGAGSAGEALSAAGTAGDPWTTALPGAYGAGTAGNIVGNNIDAPISTVDTVVDGIQTDLSNGTDGLGALKAIMDTSGVLVATGGLSAASLATDAVNEIRDGIFQGTLTEGYAADGAAATLQQMLYMIWSGLAEFAISGTTITCKKLDGTTTSMTFTLDDGTDPTSRTRAT